MRPTAIRLRESAADQAHSSHSPTIQDVDGNRIRLTVPASTRGKPHISDPLLVVAQRLVGRNGRSGSERSALAPRSATRARRRSEARVGPLASFGNAAIGVERKPDTTDLAVTAHYFSPGFAARAEQPKASRRRSARRFAILPITSRRARCRADCDPARLRSARTAR